MTLTRLAPFCGVLLMTSVLSSSPRTCAQQIIAHRGASHDAPENTLAAFELAWEKGADGIEGDFYLSSDGRIVCIHDATTKRTAGIELEVGETLLARLRTLDVGSWKDARFRDERIPTLEEVLATVPAGKKIYIEIKCGPEIVPRLKSILDGASVAPEQTIVISFNEQVIERTKQLLPEIKAYWLTGYKQDEQTGRWSPTREQVIASLKRTGADGLGTNANTQIVDEAFVAALREAGFEFHTWTIDKAELARRFAELEVDSITTNRPRFIRESLQ